MEDYRYVNSLKPFDWWMGWFGSHIHFSHLLSPSSSDSSVFNSAFLWYSMRHWMTDEFESHERQ